MDTLLIDTDAFPERANINEWARILGLGHQTMMKYRRRGQLPGSKSLSGAVLVDKATVIKCFNLDRKHK